MSSFELVFKSATQPVSMEQYGLKDLWLHPIKIDYGYWGDGEQHFEVEDECGNVLMSGNASTIEDYLSSMCN
ncbi:hypothetical protein THIAE_06040 [Thiomicrospira aerophila AL3]|uniref:Uncharacterized protein n=1 Tax=Thiomicrospira aerophila AL3 TaxID=717772 RepID=W0DYF1_9GAMM|nr:hypothetical protein [Thiomicrospira aerophila]AHF02283.1 hypothetical protein THIAE_06040 [Thiomicrospira aerophila AL3]